MMGSRSMRMWWAWAPVSGGTNGGSAELGSGVVVLCHGSYQGRHSCWLDRISKTMAVSKLVPTLNRVS